MNPAKLLLARAFDLTGLNRVLLGLQARIGGPYLRALNYHEVPRAAAAAFEAQLAFYAHHFEPVGMVQLLDLLAGRWVHHRPGLLLSFDDGLKSHAEVVAPLLERYGFPGWFGVPAGFPDAQVNDPVQFRRTHRVSFSAAGPSESPLLSWEDVRRLDERHVICCHSYTHRRLEASLSDGERTREIVEAKTHLEQRLGHQVPAFVWVGGEEWSYSSEAATTVRDAGFSLGFMTNSAPIRPGDDPFQLQRTHVEANDPPAVMRFSLSGFVDLVYLRKRRRVNRLTAPGA